MKKNQYDNEQPRRRFNEKTDGEMVRRWFALMPTKDLAQMMGLEPRQVSDYAYRKNYEPCLGKNEAERKQVARENGKKGGRPQKKSKK